MIQNITHQVVQDFTHQILPKNLNTFCSFFASSSFISLDYIFIERFMPFLKLSNLFLAVLPLNNILNHHSFFHQVIILFHQIFL